MHLAVGITQHGGGVLLLESLHLQAQLQVVLVVSCTTLRLSPGGRQTPEQSPVQGYVAMVLPHRQQWPHDPHVHCRMTPRQLLCTGVMWREGLAVAFQSLCRAAPRVVAPGVCALAAERRSALTSGCSPASRDGSWSVCLSSSPQPLPSRSIARGLSGIRIGNWGEDASGRDLGIPCAFPHLSTDLAPIVPLVSLSCSGLSHPCVSLPRLYIIMVFFQG